MANNPSHERKSGEFFKKRDAGTADPPTSSGAIPERPKAQAADHVEPDLDLWEQAYTILKDDPETEKLMKTYHKILKNLPKDEDPIDIKRPKGSKEEMSAVVDKKLKFFNTHQWKISLGKIEVDTLRKQIEHIVNVIKVVKDLGSSIAGIDPLHAGLPWAGVCLLLTLITSDSDQHAAVIKGLDHITSTIPRYSAFETSIQKGEHSPEAVKDVQDQLIHLYSLILKYQANSVCFFGRKTFKRFLLNIVPTVNWTEALQEIKVTATECDQFLNSLNMKHLKDTLQQQSRDIEKLLDELRQSDSRRDEILAWASNVPNWEDHDFVRTKLGKQYWGSGQWLFNSGDFVKWETAASGVFWLRGGVGTGKSSLTSLVIQRHLSGDSPERQAYFYCSRDPQRSGRSRPHDILRSLATQLSYAQFDPIKNKWETKKRGRGVLSLEDCTKLMIELTRSNGTYTVIIDALDECSDPFELVEGLKLITQSSKNLQIFFSSRLQDHITPEFPSASIVEINQKGDRGDIRIFIEQECRERREVIRHRFRGPEEMTDDLAETLQKLLNDRAGSMFRWVELQLDLFLVKRKPLHRNKIRAQLKALEASAALPNLNEVYSQVYEMNTEGGYEEYAAKALKWVLCSFEPLSIDALVSAVAVTVDSGRDETATKDAILNRFCSNFIVIDDAGMVRFAHVSVKEYLEKKRSEYSPLQCHTQAAVSCLAYMLRPERESSASIAEEARFEEYANVYWPYHCEEARDSRKTGDLQRLFSNFVLKPQPPCLRWFETLDEFLDPYFQFRAPRQRLEEVLKAPSTFFLACVFGFEEALEISELNLPDVDITECRVEGLYLASEQGNPAVIDYLLQSGVDIDAWGGQYGTALHAASTWGHSHIVQLLLGKGADITAKGRYGKTALHFAARAAREAAVQTLLDNGADVSAKGDMGSTALHDAASKGNEGVVLLLLDKGADISAKDDTGLTALHYATLNRGKGLIQLLLDRGVDIAAKDDRGSTAFHYAALLEDKGVVLLLLDKGADISAKDDRGYTALDYAIQWNRPVAVQVLLDNGADISAKDHRGSTALYYAASAGDKGVVLLLLDKGADISAKDDRGSRLLQKKAEENKKGAGGEQKE